MAAAFPYTMSTLNDNWFEDRLQPEGAGKLSQVKVIRKVETEIAYIGERFDTLSRIGRTKQMPSFAIPDDGYNERTTLNSLDFAHPKSRKEVVEKKPPEPNFISTETIPEVCYEERRPVIGPQRGFGAVLDRHPENFEQRHWETTSGVTYGYGQIRKGKRTDPCSIPHGAGVTVEMIANKKEGVMTGELCGENFKPDADPSQDTKVQRAWLYSADPALSNMQYSKSVGKSVPLVDNEMSLPLGEGAQKKIMEQLKQRDGMLYRNSTNITKGRGHHYGVSIFQDDP